ncbi:hypothetical protein [Nocardiopsis sp. CC223A]|uniref:hypothetical protein n=1 Tax=Nocardiopsis sp. CC223A TaxID=3044051 RepID=UPI00278C32DA|nr:hypothetical protein [Nocardiopsis sp. CC223A]
MDATPLVRLGERILERIVPKATARAAERCHFQYRCVYRSATCGGVRESRQRRRVCVDSGDTFYGSWVTVGCC